MLKSCQCFFFFLQIIFSVLFIVPLPLLASPHCFTLNVFIMNFSWLVPCINQQLTAVAVVKHNRVTLFFTLRRPWL